MEQQDQEQQHIIPTIRLRLIVEQVLTSPADILIYTEDKTFEYYKRIFYPSI